MNTIYSTIIFALLLFSNTHYSFAHNQDLDKVIIEKQSQKIRILQNQLVDMQTHYEELLSTLRNNGVLSRSQIKKLSTNKFITDYGENITKFDQNSIYNGNTSSEPTNLEYLGTNHDSSQYVMHNDNNNMNDNGSSLANHGDQQNLQSDNMMIGNSLQVNQINRESFHEQGEESDGLDKSAYELALASLKGGDFRTAEAQFGSFIKQYPESKWQSNATFWYAETFYRRSLFNKAAIHYLASYKNYPRGAKAVQSLLKLSYSLAGLDKLPDACKVLDKLAQEFPDGYQSVKLRAKEARVKFQCTE